MTNKIHLSFNRLYTLKDGDYYGATLTYRIKHGDDLLAEGEIKGKSLSQFIKPIDIEEMEITKPLSVEYVCTGNVEDISVSPSFPVPPADRPFHVSDGYVFIKDAAIRRGWLSDCKNRFADSGTMPFGGFPEPKECQAQTAKPQIPDVISTNSAPFGVTVSWKGSKNIPQGSKIQVQWIKDDYFLSATDHKVVSGENSRTITGLKAGEEIHCRLRVVSASGQKSEWSQFIKQSASSDARELLTAIYSLKVGVSDHREMKSPDELTEKVEAIIREQLKPGGILWRN